ncbi:hypothetical protein BOO93_15930 [Vibrio navarrensis]|nr:hypothetical protein [Vibrio navarrensis]
MAYSTNCFFGGEERKRWFWVLGPWSWEKRKSKGGREGPGFWALGPGKAIAEEREKKVLGSGPWVLGKQERKRGKRRSWVLGPGFWEEQKQVKQETSFLEARLRGQAKAEKQDRSYPLFSLFPALPST